MTDDIDELEWEEWDPNKLPFWQHMIAGSCAGLAEHVTIFPIDTLKTHIQCERCGSTSMFQTWNCASKIVRNEGIFRLWRGVSATFAGCIPAHAAYFSIFESMKTFMKIDHDGHFPLKAAIVGASAVIGHDLCMNPFDVIKQRMQLGYYKSVHDCIYQIFRTEGLLGFYISFPTTLLMNIPYGSIMVPVNESARKYIEPSGKYSIRTLMLSGAISGAVAAFFTTPLDVVKTRLQTQNLEPCPKLLANGLKVTVTKSTEFSQLYPSMVFSRTRDIFYHIAKTEGLRGFFRGAPARIMVQAPGVGISWTAYESIKDSFARLS